MELGRITYTSSTELLRWDGDTFDATAIWRETIVYAEGEYKLYYGGIPFWNTSDLGLAVSEDGVNYTRYSNEPIIPASEEPSWASFRIMPKTVIYEDGMYKMWFWGNDTNLFTDSLNTHGFGYATSLDGIDWNIYPDPIRVEDGALQGARLVEVVKHGGLYIAYYLDMDPSGHVLMRAVSTDGYNFTDDTPVPLGADYELFAATVYDGKVVGVWRSGDAYYLAESENGLDFALTYNIVLPDGFTPYDIVISDGEIDFYGTQYRGNVNWSWGNWSADLVTVPYGEQPPVSKTRIFFDDFERPDSEVVGNGWVEVRETLPDDPQSTGSATLRIAQGELLFDYDAEGVVPARLATFQQPYMTHDLDTHLNETGFEISFSFTAGDEARVRHFVGLADSAAGQIETLQTDRLLIPASGIGIELQRSSYLYDNSGFAIWRFDGDPDFDYEGAAPDELVARYSVPFQFDPDEEIHVSFSVDKNGGWTAIVSNETTAAKFSGNTEPLTGILDQVVMSSIEAGHPWYGNQVEIVRFDDVAVYALGEPVCELPLSEDFRMPIGPKDVFVTEDRGDEDGWHNANDFGDKLWSARRDKYVYHVGEDWNLDDGGDSEITNGELAYAASVGRVVFAGPDVSTSSFDTGYGNVVIIEHALPGGENEFVYTLYAHLGEVFVQEGECITEDDLANGLAVGSIGKTGFAPSAHLHFEVFQGDWTAAFEAHGYVETYGFYEIRDEAGDAKIKWLDPYDFIVGGAHVNPPDPVVYEGGADDGPIQGGAGDDEIRGGKGQDIIDGGPGRDILEGGRGDDAISGGSGNDLLIGGNGADELRGGFGDDHIDGGKGADSLFGGNGNDQVNGGPGDDLVAGGDDDDVLFGGDGGDTFLFDAAHESGDDVILDFTPGNDRIHIQNEDSPMSYHELVISQDGDDTVISYGELYRAPDVYENTIRLLGVDVSDLDISDFYFT